MIKLLFLWIWIFISMNGISQTKAAVELIVRTDDKEAVSITLEPLSHWEIYKYTSDQMDAKGEAVLSFEATIPFLAELNIKNNQRRVIQHVVVYIIPSASLQIEFIGKKAVFKGDGVTENRDLQQLYPLLAKLDKPEADGENILKELEENLKDKNGSSDFKEHLRKTADLKIRTNQLIQVKDDPNAGRKAVKELLPELKSAHEWLSLHTWPKALDDIFTTAETGGILPASKEGYEHRLQCIGNEEIRSRYAVYALGKLVRSRSWFGNTPTEIIRKAEPYITTAQTKEELKGIIREMEYIDKGWEHLLRKPAPDFTFEDVNGKMVSLSDFRGKFVLLDIWNIYCGPCMKQVPHLQKMEPELQKMGVETMGVSCDPQKIKDKWKATVAAKEMAGIQVIMDKGRNSKFLNDYGVLGFPTFCLINPEGYMVHPRMRYPEMPGFMEFIQQKVDDYKAIAGKKK